MLLLKLLNKLQTYTSECNIKLENASFLVSFSGGIDSTIMASLMVELRNQYKFNIGFAHINHHCHVKSDKVENFCFMYSLANNVMLHSDGLFIDSQYNFEAYAREKRYKILQHVAEKHSYNFILTAHHQDDQIETLYMKKIDGGDWLSQIGIRERIGKIRRPFLNISKKEINLYGKQQHLQWIEDPTNLDMRIRRNYIRHHLLPRDYKNNSKVKTSLLIQSQNIIKKMENTIDMIKGQEDQIIRNYSEHYVKICRKRLKYYKLEELKLFLYVLIARLLNVTFNNQSGGLWKSFNTFINHSKTGAIFKIDSLTFIINRDEVLAVNYSKLNIPGKSRLYNELKWFSGKFKIRRECQLNLALTKYNFLISESLLMDGLFVRTWNHGDKIISATSKKHVSLSDIYINNKLSKYEKSIQPVMVNNNDLILWIPGILHGKNNYNKNESVKVIKWVNR